MLIKNSATIQVHYSMITAGLNTLLPDSSGNSNHVYKIGA